MSTHPPSSPWASPPVTVFLRNLRLLHLDQQPDWPDLSARLFSGGQQTQRQRIKGVEWALYHLFALWDPEGTKNKLRPFFPPLEPLQSLNLRGALFRALSDLKKNGDLGRETILRKSMLDDCKGSKFEEVLAIFSTAVLRKVVMENAEMPGLKLALAKNLTQAEYDSLVPLILAHLSSLNTMTQKKARIRSNHDQFSRLLDEKAAELANRSQKKLQPPEEPPGSEKLVQEVKANWFGSEDWADTLLYGGSRASADGFLELPFEEAWSRANRETINDLKKPPTADLLLDLELRLSQQRDRLRRWQEFRAAIQKSEDENGPKEAPQARSKNKGLVFREHQTLTVASISKAVRQPTAGRGVLDERHEALLSSMKEALAKIKGETVPRVRPESQDAPRSKVYQRGSTRDATALSPIPDEDYRAPTPSPNITVTTPDHQSRAPSPEMAEYPSRRPFGSDEVAASRSASPSTSDDALDRQQSLSPEPDLPPLPTNQTETRASTLVERTRQSMSLLPLPRTSHSRPRRPSSRQSQKFPTNQFETPHKQQQQQQQRPHPSSRASTPRDELFSEDADYASVFKSRPRIANSPLFTPTVHVGLDYDEEDDSSLDLGGMDSSPLAGARRR
ncbi:hypothetical protein VTN77DRAFT_7325 [Rasamsonia byssochlamydoides]|uniref:uncharacterized protein n=1 Tax=Rasamsonia byssochlamydoides TaxID=89139 RepID=UPI0037423CC3